MRIIYKDKKIVAIDKPVGMSSESDKSGSVDAMTALSRILSDMGENPRLWLVHRLDNVTGGLLVFARSKEIAARLSALFSGRETEKEYLAVVEGEAHGGALTDYLYKDARQGKSFVAQRKRAGVKEARLEYRLLDAIETEGGVRSLVRVRLATGRHHQIRVQFSSRKHPIVGDGKYGSRDNGYKTPALFSCHLELNMGKERINVRIMPDIGVYPWSLFAPEKYLFD